MGIVLLIVACIVLFYFYYQSSQTRNNIQEDQRKQNKLEDEDKKKENIITLVFNKLDKLRPELIMISKKTINDSNELVNIISKNESDIKKKGGDEEILKLMMVSKFLSAFRDEIIEFQLINGTDNEIEGIKKEILEQLNWNKQEYGNFNGQYGVRWWYDSFLYTITTSTSEYSSPDKIGHTKFLKTFTTKHKIILENFDSLLNNYEYLKALGISMILFYLSDRMIKYYEIYQIFEQLGTFDKTWEKKIFKKMEEIEDNLEMISDSLKNIEYNTSKILDNTDGFISELKGINSQLDTSNLLLTINTYQTWRINRKH